MDLSAGMLRYAKKKAASRGVANVDFLQGGFLTYRHLGAPLDAIVTQLALHHLPDFWKQVALIRMAGMLKDGGKLCLRDVVFSFDVREYESNFSELSGRGGQDCGFRVCRPGGLARAERVFHHGLDHRGDDRASRVRGGEGAEDGGVFGAVFVQEVGVMCIGYYDFSP